MPTNMATHNAPISKGSTPHRLSSETKVAKAQPIVSQRIHTNASTSVVLQLDGLTWKDKRHTAWQSSLVDKFSGWYCSHYSMFWIYQTKSLQHRHTSSKLEPLSAYRHKAQTLLKTKSKHRTQTQFWAHQTCPEDHEHRPAWRYSVWMPFKSQTHSQHTHDLLCIERCET